MLAVTLSYSNVSEPNYDAEQCVYLTKPGIGTGIGRSHRGGHLPFGLRMHPLRVERPPGACASSARSLYSRHVVGSRT